MNAAYETVMDPSTVIWTLSAMLIHGLLMAVQLGLIVFLIGTGLLVRLAPGVDAPWLRGLGALRGGSAGARRQGAMRIALGVALLLPVALGASFAISLAASFATVALLISSERAPPAGAIRSGRLARRVALGSAVLLAVFTLWEGEDALALGSELIATAQGWRAHELEWQLGNDARTPKVGDLAPDFELLDPSGAVAVRLSDFRGKRPVALVFGSYT